MDQAAILAKRTGGCVLPFDAAAPDDVAITDTRDAPMA